MTHPDLDVLIVGGGPSGLACARALVRGGARVAVLEARDRVGGRTLSFEHGGAAFDLGGQWLGPTQDRAYALARELGVATFPTHHAGAHLVDVGGRVRRFTGDTPRIGLVPLVSLGTTILRIERMARRAGPGAAEAAAWDSTTPGEWGRRHVRSRRAREVLDAALRLAFGTEPAEISFLHLLCYIRSIGGLRKAAGVDGGAQQDRLAGGAQALSIGMARDLGDQVALESPVSRLVQDAGGVAATTPRGEVRASHAVLAIPPALAASIVFEPALPLARRESWARHRMGATYKAVAFYEAPFWRDDGLSGEVLAPAGPVSAVLDNSAPGGRPAALVAFAVGRQARELGERPEGERRAAVLEGLARWFGDRAARPVDFREKDWAADPWSGGCPVAAPPPGVLTVFAEDLARPIGRVHFAGTETATNWNGFIEGALEAGDRAAREVAARLAQGCGTR